MNKIKNFIEKNMLLTSIVIVLLLLTIGWFVFRDKKHVLTDQDRINIAVDSAVAPLKRQIELNNYTNDSLFKVSKARDARDRMRDIKINQQYSEIDEINKKLNEETNNVKHSDDAYVDSFLFSRGFK